MQVTNIGAKDPLQHGSFLFKRGLNKVYTKVQPGVNVLNSQFR